MSGERRVFIRDNTGGRFSISEKELPAALEDRVSGFRLETPEEAKAVADKAKYDTPTQQAIAGIEGLAGGLSLNLSELAETKLLGVKPEDIEGRKAHNELTHDIATGVGIAAPLLVTGGAAAPAAGARAAIRGAAELTAPALAARVGRGAEALAAKVVGEGATGLAGKVAQQAIPAAAQFGAEGAVYGLAHPVHELAMGDPNVTAASALEEVGLSALLGGALGGGFGVLGGLAGHAASGAKLGEKVSEWLPEFQAGRVAKASGAIQSDVSSALKKMSREEFNSQMLEAQEMGLVGMMSTPAKALEKSGAAKEAAVSRMEGVLDAAAGAGESAAPSAARVMSKARNDILLPLQKNPLNESEAGAIEKILNRYDDLLDSGNPEATVPFRALHDIRKDVDAKIYGLRGNQNISNEFKSALHDFRGIISEEIESGLKSLPGELDKLWKQANREYRVASTVERFAENGVTRELGNNQVPLTSLLSGGAGLIAGGPLGGAALGAASFLAKKYGAGIQAEAAGALRNVLSKSGAKAVAEATADAMGQEAIAGATKIATEATTGVETTAALSQLQRANQRAAKRIDELTSSVLSGAKTAAKTARGELASSIASMVGNDVEAYTKHMERVRELARNPQLLEQQLTQNTDALHEHAPNVSQSVSITTSRAVNYLHKTFPPMPKLGPLGPRLKAPKAQVWKFQKVSSVIDKPTSILAHVASGTATPDMMEALREVHPEYLSHMQVAMLDKLAGHKGSVPYKSRMGLSMFLGQDVDGTLTPQAIQAAQLTYQLPSAKSPENQLAGQDTPARTSQTGLSKLNVASQVRLPGQSADIRRGTA